MKNRLLLVLLMALLPLVAGAQTAEPPMQGLGLIMPNQKNPISIEADNGLEWRREENIYIARGNAVAQSGDVRLRADELRGYYRTTESAQFELYKLEAIGNIQLQSGQQTATAAKGFYDLDQKVLVLLGERIELQSPEARVTADDRIEYWQDKNLAVARGNAVAQQGGNRLRADVLTAYFMPQRNSQQPSLRRVEASGDVKIEAKKNLAQAEAATYDLGTNLVTLRGKVQLTQGPNQLNGEFAEMNTQTGISRMLGNQANTPGQGRVRALIIPGAAKNVSSF